MKKFVIVEKKDDSFIQCVGIRDNYDLALSKAYEYMNECIEGYEKVELTPLFTLEGDTGVGFVFKYEDIRTMMCILEVEEE